jgi:hypothetical protein
MDQRSAEAIAQFVYLIIAACIYVTPSIIALCRHHHNAAALIVLNLLTGWTFVGWVVAVVWAFMSPPQGSFAPQINVNVGIVPHGGFGAVSQHQLDNPYEGSTSLPLEGNPFAVDIVPPTKRKRRTRCATCKTLVTDEEANYCAGCGRRLVRRVGRNA